MKVLCLHGYSTNSKVLEANLERTGFTAALGDGVELVFMDATFPLEGTAGFKWYDRKEEAGATISSGVEQGVERVKQLVKDEGVEAILGFSQGGSVASLAAALSADPSWPGGKGKFKWAMFLASGHLVDDRYAEKLKELGAASIPSFHAYSQADEYYGEAIKTLALFQAGAIPPETYEHAQGHVVPAGDAEFLAKAAAFVKKHAA